MVESDISRVARVDSVLQAVEALPDGEARAAAVSAIQAIVDLYGEALSTVMQHLEPEVARGLAQDRLVGHLLLVHGLHPVPVEDRMRSALETVQPYLRSHGGSVELVNIEDGVAHVRFDGTCTGCSASETTLKGLIERAIQEAAPDLDGVEAESHGSGSFVSLECLVP